MTAVGFARVMLAALLLGVRGAAVFAGQAGSPPASVDPPALVKEVLADGVYLLRAPAALDR